MRNKRPAYVTAIILFLVAPSLLLIAEAVSSIKDKRERASALAIEKIHAQESPIAIKEDTESIFSTENPKPTEYVIPYNNMFSTPKSTYFSEIGYDAEKGGFHRQAERLSKRANRSY